MNNPFANMSALTMALIVLAIIVVAYFVRRHFAANKDGFASKRAQDVYSGSKRVFDNTSGKATFSEYKASVPDAEVVLYTDTRGLWKKGDLSPETVQKVL